MNKSTHTLARHLGRYRRHLVMTRRYMRRVFPEAALQAITESVRASEQLHGGEIRVAIEADWSLWALLRGQTARARAQSVFISLGVSDTAQHNGVLIYLCLAERSVEIIADHGLQSVSDAEWASVCSQLQAACANQQFAAGVCEAVTVTGQLIGQRFPTADRNEQPDRPTLL